MWVRAADVDGDGDVDVLGAGWTANEIAWWENTDGGGSTWVKHSVDGSFNWAHVVHAADVDGDSDIDVLGASSSDDDITWWENISGSGTVWAEHTLDGDYDIARSVHTADVDGDGDTDILGAAQGENDITWWENTSGDGSSWSVHTIDGDYQTPYTVFAANMDGDGDVDVLSSSYYGALVTWWENTSGDGSSWSEHEIDGDFFGALNMFAVDLDGDGDMDVLGASYSGSEITWWESDCIP
jgi:hypothetical protein